jgi:intracellular sulfur oxidation DsrE/DsrF family protein
MRHYLSALLAGLAFSALAPAAAASAAEGAVERVLALDAPPPGVVFEVVEWDESALNAIVPRITGYAERLRARFPELPVAVVTHGSEQFSLMTSNQDKYSDLHSQVRALSGEGDVDVHVCGNHASWRGKGMDDFPDYVDVASSAASKMGEYRALGYVVIVF